MQIILKRIQILFTGIGEPEPLRYQMQDYCSRRIEQPHRIVYYAHNKQIYITQCRFYYDE